MRRRFLWKELTSVALVFFVLCLFLPSSPAVAGWIPTRPALPDPRAELATFLERSEVARALVELGVDPAEAQRRALGLTEAEARTALGHLDSLPAGGDPFGTLIGVLLFVFVLLLITDILGLTDVFPFVRKRR